MTKQAETGNLVILLAVMNGAEYLQAQLESFTAQTFTDWQLFVGEDGSTDDSLRILEDYKKQALTRGNTVEIVKGPRAGTSSAHFLSLLERAPKAKWVAFSDQDDVWLPEKLARAVAALQPLDPEQPTLYCSPTWVTDTNLGNRVLSRLYTRPFGFRNALLQNIAAGNTIVLNRAAADLARRAAPYAMHRPGVQGHDWWLYQLITGAGGRVIQDDRPTLYYRQHGRNLVGANHGFSAAIMRTKAVLNGVYLKWNAANIAALEPVCDLFTPENQTILRGFASLRKMPLFHRIQSFRKLRLYRQTRFTHSAVWVALLLGRL